MEQPYITVVLSYSRDASRLVSALRDDKRDGNEGDVSMKAEVSDAEVF